jgi:RNA polymerase sigma factor (sigma-70 family)
MIDKKTKEYIDNIFISMENDKSKGKENIYNEVIDTILFPKHLDYREELISELYLQFVTNKNISKSINEGYFKYLFIIAAKNQLHSNTSSFHKNVRKTGDLSFDGVLDNYFQIDEKISNQQQMDLEYKKEKEIQLSELKKAMSKIKMDFFEKEMMRLYFEENHTLRQIGLDYGINHSLVFQTIEKVKERIKKQIKLSNQKLK